MWNQVEPGARKVNIPKAAILIRCRQRPISAQSAAGEAPTPYSPVIARMASGWAPEWRQPMRGSWQAPAAWSVFPFIIIAVAAEPAGGAGGKPAGYPLIRAWRKPARDANLPWTRWTPLRKNNNDQMMNSARGVVAWVAGQMAAGGSLGAEVTEFNGAYAGRISSGTVVCPWPVNIGIPMPG